MNPIYTGRLCRSSTPNRPTGRPGDRRLEAERFRAPGDLPARGIRTRAGQGLDCSYLRRAPRRDHRSEVRPGLPGPATGWRDAWEIRRHAQRAGHAGAAIRPCAVDGGEPIGAQPGPMWRPRHPRRRGYRSSDDYVPAGLAVSTASEETVSSWAADVPALGRWWRQKPGQRQSSCWPTGPVIGNETPPGAGDPDRGGRSTAAPPRTRAADAGTPHNELAVYAEYSAHPQAGDIRGTCCRMAWSWSRRPAEVYSIAFGGRTAVVTGRIVDGAAVLRQHADPDPMGRDDRLDRTTITVDESVGEDQQLRLRWLTRIAAMLRQRGRWRRLSSAVACAGSTEPGSSIRWTLHPWTLENPANGWFWAVVRKALGITSAGDSAAVYPIRWPR